MFLFKIFNSNKHQFTLHLIIMDLDEHILDGELANTELKYEEYLQPASPSLQTAAVPPCLLLLLLRLPLLLSQPTSLLLFSSLVQPPPSSSSSSTASTSSSACSFSSSSSKSNSAQFSGSAY